ncbi:MAG: MbnH family di-heme enzyme, partial [Acidobacteriota bacterium]
PSFTEYVTAAGRLLVSLARPSDYDWGLPGGFPEPRVPDDNPMTAAKVELGRHLFYDRRLSGNGLQSCASCHRQELAFSDGLALAVGSTGETHPRNSMALVNVAYNATLTWAHPELEQLEDQITTPMFGTHPVELGITGHEDEVLERLQDDTTYARLFRDAFPGDPTPIEWNHIVKALASFTRTLISVDSPYDRFVYRGDTAALSASARRGMELFLSEDFECHHCHGGFNFSVASVHVATAFPEKVFHNTGLYDLGDGAYPPDNLGAFEITHRSEDMGKFRPPTLRNIAVTAPYMHDGSIATLDEVLDTYAAGGRHLRDGPHAGDGRRNPFKSGFVPGFPISEQEKRDLLAFLRALTDEAFLTDPRFADPFPIQSSAAD